MYCPSENDSITTSQAKPLQLITCGKVVYSGAEQFGTILVSLASSPPASDQSSLFIHRRVLARTRSSLHDRVIQLPQEFYTVSPVAEIRFIWFSRPFCLFSIIPHKNQKLWLFCSAWLQTGEWHEKGQDHVPIVTEGHAEIFPSRVGLIIGLH